MALASIADTLAVVVLVETFRNHRPFCASCRIQLGLTYYDEVSECFLEEYETSSEAFEHFKYFNVDQQLSFLELIILTAICDEKGKKERPEAVDRMIEILEIPFKV